MSETARDYQEKAINEIRQKFLDGDTKVLLWLATGAGKTFIFCRIVKEAVARGKRAIIVVRGRKLVDQASKRLFREHVAHGTLMANHWNYRPQLPVQVCSIDTILARNLNPESDIDIIDEGHLFTEGSKAAEWLSKRTQFQIPVTATPYLKKGIKHLAQSIVHPISMLELISLGYLTSFRYFAPAAPDMTGARVSQSTGEYRDEDAERAMIAGDLTGKIIDHYLKILVDKPTICFAVNISHSKTLVKNFLAAGVKAEHCDADTPDSEREEIIKRLESGETKVVSNVGIFCTGVDIPCLGGIILARPIRDSLSLFIQQCGRGTRPIYADGFDLSTANGRLAAIANSFKPNCIVLDHAGNIQRFGLPTDEPSVNIYGEIKDSHLKKSKICKNCFAVFRASKCPECGIEAPASEEVEIEETNDELKEITGEDLDPIIREFKKLTSEGIKKGRSEDWAMNKLIEKLGFEVVKYYLPEEFVRKYMSKKAREFFKDSRFRGVRG